MRAAIRKVMRNTRRTTPVSPQLSLPFRDTWTWDNYVRGMEAVTQYEREHFDELVSGSFDVRRDVREAAARLRGRSNVEAQRIQVQAYQRMFYAGTVWPVAREVVEDTVVTTTSREEDR